MIKGCDTCKHSGESAACNCPNGACLTTEEGYPKWEMKADLIVELNKKVKLTKQDAELLLLSIYPNAMPSVINDGLLKMIDNGYILPDPVEEWDEIYRRLTADPMVKPRWIEQANNAIQYLKQQCE